MSARDFSAPTLAEAGAALNHLDSACARDDWVQIGMAIKSEFGDAGFDMWDQWSQAAEGYKITDAKNTWRSIKGAGGITISTLFSAAIEAGWGYKRNESSAGRAHRESAHADRATANLARQEKEGAEKVALQKDVAAVCRKIRDKCLSRDGEAPYLAFKGVEAFGVGFVKAPFIVINNLQDNTVELLIGASFIGDFFNSKPRDNEDISFRYVKPGTLVVPLKDADNELWNFQLIYPGGKNERPGQRKSFLKGGRKRGLFHIIPGVDRWGVAEGYATGATCHQATNWTVAVAFDAGNLAPVCRVMCDLYPKQDGVVLGDDDIDNPKNPGRTKAELVASELSIPALFPQFDNSSIMHG